MTEEENWEGFKERECSDHRTVGPHRAWCHDDHEWCYPSSFCRGCELPALRAERDSLVAQLVEIQEREHETSIQMSAANAFLAKENQEMQAVVDACKEWGDYIPRRVARALASLPFQNNLGDTVTNEPMIDTLERLEREANATVQKSRDQCYCGNTRKPCQYHEGMSDGVEVGQSVLPAFLSQLRDQTESRSGHE